MRKNKLSTNKLQEGYFTKTVIGKALVALLAIGLIFPYNLMVSASVIDTIESRQDNIHRIEDVNSNESTIDNSGEEVTQEEDVEEMPEVDVIQSEIVNAVTAKEQQAVLLVAGTVTSETELIDAIQTESVIELANDIQLTDTLTIPSGKDITLAGSASLIGADGDATITVAGNATLRLTGITVTHNNGEIGRGIIVNPNGSLIMSSGSISGNTYDVDFSGSSVAESGGGVFVGTGGSFTMSGDARVENNTINLTASNSGTVYGGGIVISNNGTFTMSGNARITNNAANLSSGSGGGAYGGGIALRDGTTFTMSGNAVIEDNTSEARAASSSSSAYGGGVSIGSNGSFVMSGSARVENNTAGAYATGIASYSYGGGVHIGNNTDFTMNNSTLVIGNVALTSLGNASYSNGGGVYMDGRNFVMNDLARVENNNTKIVDAGYNAHNGSGINMMRGTLTMNDDTKIIGNSAVTQNSSTDNPSIWAHGGGVLVGYYNTSTMIMNDNASVEGNNTQMGGGVSVSDYGFGTLIMNDNSRVQNNRAATGGGIRMSSYGNAVLTMNDDSKVTENTSSASGAGIFVSRGSGVFITMNQNSAVENNTINASTSGAIGGGIVARNAVVVMNDDSTVNNNTINVNATSGSASGGGIHVAADSTTSRGSLTMNDNAQVAENTINSNSASSSGGGVIIQGSIFTMNDNANITNNTLTTGIGGGVLLTGGSSGTGELTMNDGKITGNTATNGGGVYIAGANGLFDMVTGEVSNNTATQDGGGVWVAHANLDRLFVGEEAIFANNKARAAYDRASADDVMYYAQIAGTKWTVPLTQGYNNFDIRYTQGTQVTLEYMLSFELNGTAESVTTPNNIPNVSVIKGTYIKNAEGFDIEIKRAGFIFGGWYMDSELTIPVENTVMPEEDTTIYASWIQDEDKVIDENEDEDKTTDETVDQNKDISNIPTTGNNFMVIAMILASLVAPLLVWSRRSRVIED